MICFSDLLFVSLLGIVAADASAFVNPSSVYSSNSQSLTAKLPIVADVVKKPPRLLSPTILCSSTANNYEKDGKINPNSLHVKGMSDLFKTSSLVLVSLYASAFFALGPMSVHAAEGGASNVANSKITTGGASTLQTGRTIAITRGVNLDNSDFSNQNLKGVAFQQSIVRNANFKGSNLVGASFFDATLDGTDFEDTDMTQVNLEMAQLSRANLKNAVVREMYVGGATIFDGIKNIENTDWTDTYLSKYQKKLLCNHPTAIGTNPVTGVDTRESLMCTD
mmetsp:Transcript_17023/g.32213  ORF Transcript_17023/g.32213 Transcript_17023/m.32213 type:complete len:279 (-) Transcript_17023:357-1193(-)